MITPSLAMIPQAYKSGKVYSQLPVSGDGDFDFTRASSATRVNKDGFIEEVAVNVPRLDYSDGGCPSLLLEPTRSNLITYSEAFDNAYWTKNASSVVSGQLSPKGDLSAFKLVENTSTNSHKIFRANAFASNVEYTYSFFAKKGERDFVSYVFSGVSNIASVYFDLNNGVVGSTNVVSGMTLSDTSIKSFPDGWYRCSLTFTQTINTSANITISDIDYGANTPSYQGDGTSGVYIYGAQLEQGSYATSYIPTSGQSGGVTRVGDVCNNGGNEQVINSTEGVLYYESKVHSLTGDKAISVSAGSYQDSVSIGSYGGVFQARIRQGGNYVHFISPSGVNLLNNNKIAILYSASSIKIFVNGVLKSNVSGVTYSAILSKISFTRADSVDFYYGEINDLRYYNTALTDAELQALTTI